MAAGNKAYHRLLDVDEEIANELCEEYGYFGYGTIDTSVYDNMPQEAHTMYISTWSLSALIWTKTSSMR